MIDFWVTIARGTHPFPSRTRQLSLSAPMVLHRQLCGRVGSCPVYNEGPDPMIGLFAFMTASGVQLQPRRNSRPAHAGFPTDREIAPDRLIRFAVDVALTSFESRWSCFAVTARFVPSSLCRADANRRACQRRDKRSALPAGFDAAKVPPRGGDAVRYSTQESKFLAWLS